MTALDGSTGLYLLYFGAPLVLAVGAWLTGLVLHGLGRSTTLALAVVVFAFGLLIGTSLTTFLGSLQRQPNVIALVGSLWFIALPLIAVVVLAMAGRRRAAGLLLAGAAAPWAALGAFYVAEILLGVAGSLLVAVAMLLAGLGPLLIGVALIAAGDPTREPDPEAPIGWPGSRRPGTMGHRFVAAATYGTVGPSFVLAVVAAALVGYAVPGQPLVQLAITLAAAAIGTEIELRWIPPQVRPAVEAFHWVGRGELERFRTATGEATPTSPKAFRTWLAQHPESDLTRPWRVEMLNFLGEYGEARAELERWTPSSPFEHLHRASLATEAGWQQGGPGDVPALASKAAETGPDGSAERLAADGLIAWWSSRTALAAMDPDWQRPLATFRGRLGAAADGLHAKALRRRTVVLPAIIGAGIVLLGLLTPGPPA